LLCARHLRITESARKMSVFCRLGGKYKVVRFDC
jgi:hypothetical protein